MWHNCCSKQLCSQPVHIPVFLWKAIIIVSKADFMFYIFFFLVTVSLYVNYMAHSTILCMASWKQVAVCLVGLTPKEIVYGISAYSVSRF